jgi:shikimate kinase
MVVYLIGFMGCGKTTVGKYLSKQLGYEFIDLDKKFETLEKIKIYKFFELQGEEKFRLIEQKILTSIDTSKNTIVATGGGTPCYFDNMEFMRQTGITVYLQIQPELISKRLKNSHIIRPKIKNKNNEEIIDWVSKLLDERKSVYEKAHIIIDARSITTTQLIKALLPFSLSTGNITS